MNFLAFDVNRQSISLKLTVIFDVYYVTHLLITSPQNKTKEIASNMIFKKNCIPDLYAALKIAIK